jgi:carbon-monoxide dehydrogenase small subunit
MAETYKGPISYRLWVNGQEHAVNDIEPRVLLADVLRDVLRLTGTHLGCEHGVCGACTVLLDGRPVRSCLLLGVQARGHRIETVESLAAQDGTLSPLQEAFWNHHALQCGFCTPGILMTAQHFIATHATASRQEIRDALSGNLCRCTGYQFIVDAIEDVMAQKKEPIS